MRVAPDRRTQVLHNVSSMVLQQIPQPFPTYRRKPSSAVSVEPPALARAITHTTLTSAPARHLRTSEGPADQRPLLGTSAWRPAAVADRASVDDQPRGRAEPAARVPRVVTLGPAGASVG